MFTSFNHWTNLSCLCGECVEYGTNSEGNQWQEIRGRNKEILPNAHIASTTGFISHLPVGMNAARSKQ